MVLFGVIVLVLVLALPSLLCCMMGGGYLLVGLIALGCWFFLLYLILTEFWQWYQNPDQNDQDQP